MAVTVKLPTLSSHLRRPLKPFFKKADRGLRTRGGRAFRPRQESPARRERFPARSLLGAKKFPASPLRELCRKDLKSNAISARISPKRPSSPANSLRAGNFYRRRGRGESKRHAHDRNSREYCVSWRIVAMSERKAQPPRSARVEVAASRASVRISAGARQESSGRRSGRFCRAAPRRRQGWR